MVGLSFSFSKRAEPKRVVEALAREKETGDKRQAVLAVEGGQVTLDGPQEAAKKLVIACRNPLAEVARQAPAVANKPSRPAAASPDELPAGLVKRNLDSLSEEDAAAARQLFREAAASGDGPGDADAMLGNQHVVPILMRPGSKRVREASSAPEASADMYDAVPVESFGEALLRGMGFDPDKHKTKPVWHDKPRDNLLGLGAKALLPHEKMIVTGKGKSKGTSRPLGGASAGSVTSSTTLPSSAAEGDDRAEAAGEVQDGAPAERSPANAAGVSSAGGPAAQDEKRRRIAAAGASGASNGSQAKNGRNHVWASRGLVVRIVGKAGQLREFFGLEAVVLEADEASGLCRIKARKGDTSHTLPGVGIADLETRVSRACSAVRIVRGAHRGKTTDLVRRDVQRGIALVRLGGEETELQLDDVCQFMA